VRGGSGAAVVFRIDARSDVPIYRQLVQQVRRDVMLGRLRPGDEHGVGPNGSGKPP
jgi:hypothetical protein